MYIVKLLWKSWQYTVGPGSLHAFDDFLSRVSFFV